MLGNPFSAEKRGAIRLKLHQIEGEIYTLPRTASSRSTHTWGGSRSRLCVFPFFVSTKTIFQVPKAIINDHSWLGWARIFGPNFDPPRAGWHAGGFPKADSMSKLMMRAGGERLKNQRIPRGRGAGAYGERERVRNGEWLICFNWNKLWLHSFFTIFYVFFLLSLLVVSCRVRTTRALLLVIPICLVSCVVCWTKWDFPLMVGRGAVKFACRVDTGLLRPY